MKSLPLLPLPAIVALVLIGASGCGLSDYQTRLDANRERLQQFDEANQLLDDPIEVPRIQLPATKDSEAKEGRAWPFEVYLRLPKGFVNPVKERAPYNNFFFRYPGGEGAYAIFVAGALVADPKQKKEDELPFGHLTSEAFRDKIKPSLEDYCLKALNIQPPLKEKTKPAPKDVKLLTPYPNVSGTIRAAYTFYTLTDEESPTKLTQHNAFDVYVHERNTRQVCMVVHRPLQANSASLKNAIEACLGSLDVSGDAMNKRAEYRKAKGLN